MIGHQQKDRKQGRTEELASVYVADPATKTTVADGSDMVIDPALERFSSTYFMPKKHKEDECRLANSLLPPFK